MNNHDGIKRSMQSYLLNVLLTIYIIRPLYQTGRVHTFSVVLSNYTSQFSCYINGFFTCNCIVV